MNKQQAHSLKLAIAVFAEATAMLQYATSTGRQSELDLAITNRDKARDDVYSMLDSLSTEE
jgi:hypothetical protein